MTIKRKSAPQESSSTVEYDNLVGGDFEGRLIYVADLGLHTHEHKGVQKPDVQKLAMCFEILDNPVTIDGEQVPRTIWAASFNVYNSLTALGTELKY